MSMAKLLLLRVVIINVLGQRQKSAQNAENTTNLPKNFIGAFFMFHNQLLQLCTARTA